MSILERRPVLIAILMTTLVSFVAAFAAQRASASDGSRIPFLSPRIPKVEVACLTKGTHRYVGKSRPKGECEIGGVVETFLGPLLRAPEGLGRGGSFARFPIRGFRSEAGTREPIA
jgi:hypothetical protein